jgi:hypothetical protein
MVRRALVVGWALLFVACSGESEVCHDGKDNDDNRLIDCADSACAGASCGPNGLVCAADQTCTMCAASGGVVGAAPEATCDDATDNDCDGRIDCDDPDCQPQGSEPGQVCNVQGHRCSAPDVLGRSGCGGVIGGGGTPVVGSISIVSAQYDVLGARDSGYQEQSLLTFEVRTAYGKPFPAGLRVSFSHESQGQSFIGMPPVCNATSPNSPIVCKAEATTDETGLVQVLLTSGDRFAVLSVRAEATSGGVTRHVVAGGFTVIGAKPNGAHFSVDCRPYNVPALTVHDCLYSRYAGTARTVDCTATVGDRHGNLVAVPTLVSFLSEAGEIVPAAFTPAFDPRSSALAGQAVGVLDVYGAPLPYDVDPIDVGALAHETRVENFNYGCGARTTNPRDGLVTVIALVEGEEGFVDENFNAKYDLGEPWIDLGEPFLDVDDDGVRDTDLNRDGVHDDGEWYLDVDGDGIWSGPNGRWDASTVLWTEHRVLYTGYPLRATDGTGNELFTRFYTAGVPPSPTPPAPEFLVHKGPPPTTAFYDVFFTDQHLNQLGPLSSFDISAFAGNVTPSLSPVTHTADSLGTTFTYMYCDTDQSAPNVRNGPWRTGNCADGPADQACRTTPCYLAPEVGRAFLYGNRGVASIKCAEIGPDVVQVHATVDNVTTLFSIAGECVP